MVKVELIFPIENYTLYGEDLKLRYKLVNNLKKYNVHQIVFSLDGGEIIKDTELSGSYTFSSLANGEHTILGYLSDINNKKIEQSNFSITFNVLFKEHTPENVTWQLSKSKLPEFIQEDFKTFSRFIEAYYEWLHKSNNPVYTPFNSEFFMDVDHTPEIFLSRFRTQYLNDFPANIFDFSDTKNFKTILKNIKQFYRAKGTEKSVKFLFRLLYNSYVEFYYPKKDLMRASGDLWVEPVSIKIKNIVPINAFQLKNGVVYQTNASNAIISSARVLEVLAQKVADQTIYELTIANIIGEFNGDLPLYADLKINDKDTTISADLLTVISSISITSNGLRVGDQIVIQSSDSTDLNTGTGYFGIIRETSLRGLPLQIRTIDSGYNYSGHQNLYKKSKNGILSSILGSVNIGVLTQYSGYYKTISSMPSSSGKLQDNRKYQELSYVLQTELNLFQYIENINRLVHPAGVGIFGSFLVKRKFVADTNLNKQVDDYYAPLIGNYLPYTLNSSVDLRNTGTFVSDLYPGGFDPTQPSPNENSPTDYFTHNPVTSLSSTVAATKFRYIPEVSDKTEINTYWIVFNNPNILLDNTALDIKDITIRDLLRIPLVNNIPTL